MQSRSLTTALLITATLTGWAAQAGSPAPEPTFTVSFPGGLSPAGPIDGRVILLLSRDLKREPRSHVSPNEPLDSPYLFGLTVDGLVAGHAAVIDQRAFGWPAARLAYSRLHYNVQYLPKILQRIAATAPAGADLKSWRY